jgi:hypothetical protein
MSAWLFTDKGAFGNPSGNGDPTQEELVAFARCLTEKGWVMYSSFTCSACGAQRKAFGKAFNDIKVIECNPYAPNTQVELCLKRKIRKTPSWLLEKNEKEIKRIESYQLLKSLAHASGCKL